MSKERGRHRAGHSISSQDLFQGRHGASAQGKALLHPKFISVGQTRTGEKGNRAGDGHWELRPHRCGRDCSGTSPKRRGRNSNKAAIQECEEQKENVSFSTAPAGAQRCWNVQLP